MNRFADRRARRGASALELALALPMLLGFILATVDLGRYVGNIQRASAAAASVADLASQAELFTNQRDPDKVTTGKEVGVLNIAAREVAAPLDLFKNGVVIVTVLANPEGNGVSQTWQCRWGRTDVASRVGPTTPQGVTLGRGEAAVYAEVVYRFKPFVLSASLLGLDQDSDYHAISVRRPRLTGPKMVPTC